MPAAELTLWGTCDVEQWETTGVACAQPGPSPSHHFPPSKTDMYIQCFRNNPEKLGEPGWLTAASQSPLRIGPSWLWHGEPWLL